MRHEHTWSEYIASAQAAVEQYPSEKHHGSDPRWSGGSFDQAVRMATVTGYEAAVVNVEPIVNELAELVDKDLFQTTFTSRFDVAGAEVDMGRFLSGEPECMIESTPIRISRQGRAVRITVNVGYRGHVGADQVERRGAAVLALVDILARAQHPLEVWVARTTEHHGGRLTHTVLVQDANEPLDMGRVMYAIAHTSFHRRLTFAVLCHDGMLNGNKGGSVDLEPEDLAQSDSGTSIVLASSLKAHESWDLAYSIAWIKEQLALIFGEE